MLSCYLLILSHCFLTCSPYGIVYGLLLLVVTLVTGRFGARVYETLVNSIDFPSCHFTDLYKTGALKSSQFITSVCRRGIFIEKKVFKRKSWSSFFLPFYANKMLMITFACLFKFGNIGYLCTVTQML